MLLWIPEITSGPITPPCAHGSFLPSWAHTGKAWGGRARSIISRMAIALAALARVFRTFGARPLHPVNVSVYNSCPLACLSRSRGVTSRRVTANLRKNILDFRGFGSSIILNSRGGHFRSIGNFPESLSQRILAGIILVGRLDVCNKYYTCCNSQCTVIIHICMRVFSVGLRACLQCSTSRRECLVHSARVGLLASQVVGA